MIFYLLGFFFLVTSSIQNNSMKGRVSVFVTNFERGVVSFIRLGFVKSSFTYISLIYFVFEANTIGGESFGAFSNQLNIY